MNTFFSADYVLPITGDPIKNGVVEVTDRGIISEIHAPHATALAHQEVKSYSGIIVPGFINTHCHLELSHMAGVIPQRIGLIPFLQRVMSSRSADEACVLEAMQAADQAMYDRGIVAVGDHANTAISATIKASSKLYYHTFVEVIGFEPQLAQQKLEEAEGIANTFSSDAVSLTAHAPYSVSRELFKLLNEDAIKRNQPLSIHNQESEEENKLFRYKTGQFLDFYRALNKDISDFKAQARNSLQTYLTYLSPTNPVLLVHNTYTSPKDIFFISRQDRNITWCFCPKANRYIEGTLPKLSHFTHDQQRLTLGTDSLASNDRLCILSELKTLHQTFPELSLTDTIKWATINGAAFLGIADRYGSLEVGKKPGLNLLTHTNGLAITSNTEVIRLGDF